MTKVLWCLHQSKFADYHGTTLLREIIVKPNQYQEEKYGHNMSLHNETKKGWRCTVCGMQKSGEI